MADLAQVKDIMSREILSVGVEDSLELVSQLFEKYNYDGMPVIDARRRLVGIITAYDMIVQSSGMHLPTVLNIMQKISVNKADRKDLDEHFGKLKTIKAKDIMNANPLVVTPDVSLEEAAKVFAEHHRVNPLVVVDGDGVLVGVVSRYDIIRFFNERYFQQVVKETPMYRQQRASDRAKSDQAINSTVSEISDEFLLVTKKRPRIWKYAAVAAFIAGLVAATALIIRIVREPDQFGTIIHTFSIVNEEKMLH